MSIRIKKLLDSFAGNHAIAIIEANQSISRSVSYQQLHEGINHAQEKFDQENLKKDCVVGIQSDFHITSIEYFLALLSRGNTVAMLSPQNQNLASMAQDANIEKVFRFDENADVHATEFEKPSQYNALVQQLFDQVEPGFILFPVAQRVSQKPFCIS